MATKTMPRENNVSFEEALSKLEHSSEALKNEEISLEATMRYFEEGIKYYNLCSEMLTEAKQKIEFYKQD